MDTYVIDYIMKIIKDLIKNKEYVTEEKKFIGVCIFDILNNGWSIKKSGNNYKLKKII
tara:strand:- start:506 stop:679 length:174 start_codon:yes stop_codon:yes gene_type:complete